MDRKLAVILSAILVALIGPIIKIISPNIHPLSINFFRLLFAFLFLLILMPFMEKNVFRVSKRDIKEYIFMGFLIALTFSLYVLALSLAPVSNVVVISGFSVIFVAILSLLILKEHLKFNQKISIFIAIIGLAIINPFNLSNQYFLGNMIAFFQTISFSFLIVYLRKEEKKHSLSSLMWFFLFATLFLSPMVFIFGIGTNFLNILPYLIFLGIFTTGVAYLLLSYGAQKLHADLVSIINMITVPLAAILFAMILINETPSIRILIGGTILISSGVVLHYIRKKHIKAIKKQLHIC